MKKLIQRKKGSFIEITISVIIGLLIFFAAIYIFFDLGSFFKKVFNFLPSFGEKNSSDFGDVRINPDVNIGEVCPVQVGALAGEDNYIRFCPDIEEGNFGCGLSEIGKIYVVLETGSDNGRLHLNNPGFGSGVDVGSVVNGIISIQDEYLIDSSEEYQYWIDELPSLNYMEQLHGSKIVLEAGKVICRESVFEIPFGR